jgi:4-hydroxybenzoate polyprenyltransferase
MIRILLSLGRVSNLPTVWTNAMAGMWLAGAAGSPGPMAAIVVAVSLFYTGGMFLNDAFDRDVDARERPERPIPSGRIAARTVFWLGAGQLAAGFLLLIVAGTAVHANAPVVAAAAAAMVAAIVLYDAAHRSNPFAPWIMGLCRALVYGCAAAASGPSVAWPSIAPAAVTLVAYTAAVTYVAAREASSAVGPRWPLALLLLGPLALVASGDATRASTALALASAAWSALAVHTASGGGGEESVRDGVTRLIAGMSILDAAWIATTNATGGVWIALAGLPATRLLQRRVAGT